MDKALLTRATSKDDTPTPGYLYGEIARMTQHSYDTCTKVQDFLISRVRISTTPSSTRRCRSSSTSAARAAWTSSARCRSTSRPSRSVCVRRLLTLWPFTHCSHTD